MFQLRAKATSLGKTGLLPQHCKPTWQSFLASGCPEEPAFLEDVTTCQNPKPPSSACPPALRILPLIQHPPPSPPTPAPGVLPSGRPSGVTARLADSPAIAREPPAHSCGTLAGLQPRSLPPSRVAPAPPTPRARSFLRHPAPASRPQPGCRSGPLRRLQGLGARRASASRRLANRCPQPASESRLYPRPAPPPPKPTNGKDGAGAGPAVA
ncbi:uncharacterized protein LOC130877101 [Chionomys nivalis]|uniref:uncharacterized protein LOC130877101 n=1 Tax=Chionomys nivalis TaxID=269649 RepID=UPI00259851F0|nr:uncharacterized protein LOC130877101 [Chionomys nivalis]